MSGSAPEVRGDAGRTQRRVELVEYGNVILDASRLQNQCVRLPAAREQREDLMDLINLGHRVRRPVNAGDAVDIVAV
ncbi:MAG TPA: hypothetical protein PLF56_04030 [Micropruina sp.]|nr:hypothetical protein [Micropruina sp.]